MTIIPPRIMISIFVGKIALNAELFLKKIIHGTSRPFGYEKRILDLCFCSISMVHICFQMFEFEFPRGSFEFDGSLL